MDGKTEDDEFLATFQHEIASISPMSMSKQTNHIEMSVLLGKLGRRLS